MTFTKCYSCRYSSEQNGEHCYECVKGMNNNFEPFKDCRNCKKWDECPCGKKGHENGTSQGYSIGECEDYESCENYIRKEDAVNALKRALYNYEDKTEKQFKVSKELNLEDWFQHRIFVQNMNDIDIQTILELPPVKPQPFINKPCISEGVCHEDKVNVLDKIQAEIEHLTITEGGEDYIRKMAELYSLKIKVLQIIDKYKAENEEEEVENEEQNSLLTADERALFLNKLTHWLKDNFNDIVIGGWQDTDGEIFDLFFIKREPKTVKEK